MEKEIWYLILTELNDVEKYFYNEVGIFEVEVRFVEIQKQTIFMTLPLNLLPLVTQFLPLALLHLTPDSFSASWLRIMNPLYFLNGIKNNVHRSVS